MLRVTVTFREFDGVAVVSVGVRGVGDLLGEMLGVAVSVEFNWQWAPRYAARQIHVH